MKLANLIAALQSLPAESEVKSLDVLIRLSKTSGVNLDLETVQDEKTMALCMKMSEERR